MEPFIAQIMMFGGNFAPRGWAFCNGQLLPIASHSALFSILGTTYGGDGETTFGLPDLRGRTPVHSGNNSAGPGLSAISLGQKGGKQAIGPSDIPNHTHPLVGVTDAPTSAAPTASHVLGQGEIYGPSAGTPQALNTIAIGTTGGGATTDVRAPYLGINFIIALQGIFPSP